MSESPAATVVITTKNRKEDLRGAVASALVQSAPVEVLVIDDGSTDGTAEMVRSEFPAARVIRHEQSCGYIVRRNEGAELAAAPVVVSIDDDAAFPSPDTVAQTLRDLNHPRVGAVAVPFVNVNQSPAVRQKAPDDARVYVTDQYIGTAHAVRRDLFLALGSYRSHLVHQGEEEDFCLRMLAAGYVVRVGRADPIHHFESPRRDFRRMDYYGRRNNVLFAWHNTPLVVLPAHIGMTTLNGLRHAARTRRVWHNLKGLAAGWVWAATHPGARAPVPLNVFRLARELKRGQAIPLDRLGGRLPHPRNIPQAGADFPEVRG